MVIKNMGTEFRKPGFITYYFCIWACYLNSLCLKIIKHSTTTRISNETSYSKHLAIYYYCYQCCWVLVVYLLDTAQIDITNDPKTLCLTTVSICSYTQGSTGQLWFGWACLDLSWVDLLQNANTVEHGFRLWIGFRSAPWVLVLGPRIQGQQMPGTYFSHGGSPMCKSQVELYEHL